MRKFSNINEASDIKKYQQTILEQKIEELLESLDVEISGTDKPESIDVNIKPNSKFLESLKSLINYEFNKEKLNILENAKTSIITKNSLWLDKEIEKLK